MDLKRYIESLLFEVKTGDPAAFIAAPVALMIIAAPACYLPARRAISIDPNAALRQEQSRRLRRSSAQTGAVWPLVSWCS